MKKISTLILGLLIIAGSSSFAQEKKKSPAVTLDSTIDATQIIIKYSSPSMRGRDIYGDLVPFNKLWRAGANEATTVEFSTDVLIEGKKLPAGIYSFFVTPKESGKWSVVFNSDSKQWGAYKRDAEADKLVVNVPTKKIDETEKLTYRVDKNHVYLDWEKTRLFFTVATLFEKD